MGTFGPRTSCRIHARARTALYRNYAIRIGALETLEGTVVARQPCSTIRAAPVVMVVAERAAVKAVAAMVEARAAEG